MQLSSLLNAGGSCCFPKASDVQQWMRRCWPRRLFRRAEGVAVSQSRDYIRALVTYFRLLAASVFRAPVVFTLGADVVTKSNSIGSWLRSCNQLTAICAAGRTNASSHCPEEEDEHPHTQHWMRSSGTGQGPRVI